MSLWLRVMALIFSVSSVLIMSLMWLFEIDIFINKSPSMPMGIYLGFPADTINHGNLVVVCLPKGANADLYAKRGYLPHSKRCSQSSGLAPILKRVVAMDGDEIEISFSGTKVNGLLIENSRLSDVDSRGERGSGSNRCKSNAKEFYFLKLYLA